MMFLLVSNFFYFSSSKHSIRDYSDQTFTTWKPIILSIANGECFLSTEIFFQDTRSTVFLACHYSAADRRNGRIGSYLQEISFSSFRHLTSNIFMISYFFKTVLYIFELLYNNLERLLQSKIAYFLKSLNVFVRLVWLLF